MILRKRMDIGKSHRLQEFVELPVRETSVRQKRHFDALWNQLSQAEDDLVFCMVAQSLGPEGGTEGGRIVAAGTPREVAKLKTATGRVLKSVFSDEAPPRASWLGVGDRLGRG